MSHNEKRLKLKQPSSDSLLSRGGIMDSSGKVIDLRKRLKKQDGNRINNENDHSNASELVPVVDISQRRQEKIDSERRGVKRTILSEFIGAHIIVPNRGLQKCTIYDISDNGISFDLPVEIGKLKMQEEVAMRVYLNHSTYFPFFVNVTFIRHFKEEGIYRHGAAFAKGTINDAALHHFVKFIENVSTILKTDKGDVIVSNLKK